MQTLEGASNDFLQQLVQANSTAARMATSFATHGNFGEALDELKSPDFLRTLGTQTIIAAATAGLSHQLKIQNAGFVGRLNHNLVQGAVTTGAEAVIEGKDLGEVLKNNALNAAVGTVSGYGAEKIGAAYAGGEFEGITHKVLHGVLGAFSGGTLGAIKGEDFVKCAASGAAGAMIGELIAETYRETLLSGEGIPLSEIDKHKEYASTLAQATAVMTTTLAGGNINTCQLAAKNAAENNAFFNPLDYAVTLFFFFFLFTPVILITILLASLE